MREEENMNRIEMPFENLMKNFMINPITSWKKFFNPQFYFSYNTGDEDVENTVLAQVGSYGKQLGQIIDALDVLVDRVPVKELKPEQQCALAEFRKLSRDVKTAVAAFKRPGEKDNMRAFNALISELPSLARSDPQLVAQLRRALDEVEGHDQPRR